MDIKEVCTQILAVKPTGKILWPRRKCKVDITMDFKEIGDNTRNWIHPTRDSVLRAFVNSTLNLRVP